MTMEARTGIGIIKKEGFRGWCWRRYDAEDEDWDDRTTCSQTCLLEMKPRVLSMHLVETRIAPRQASALNNEKP